MNLEITILWWHCLSVGFFLLVLDLLVVNSFYLMWLGLGLLPVAVLLGIFPTTSILLQALIWIGSSSVSIFIWRKLRHYGKKFDPSTMVGITCVVANWNEGKGQVRLQRPYNGRDVWNAKSDEQFATNDSCKVTAVDPNDKFVMLSKI